MLTTTSCGGFLTAIDHGATPDHSLLFNTHKQPYCLRAINPFVEQL